MRIHILSAALALSACANSSACNSPHSNTKTIQCAQLELTSQTKVLEQTTKRVSQVIPSPTDLVKANEIWEEYSNTHCRSVTKIYEGGSNFNLALTMCLIEQAKQRTKVIEQDYSDAISIITNGSP